MFSYSIVTHSGDEYTVYADSIENALMEARIKHGVSEPEIRRIHCNGH